MKKERYIPEGFREFAPDMGDYPKDLFSCYVNLEQPHKPRAMFFIGKRYKSEWYFYFRTIEEMKQRINDSISNVMKWHEYREEKRIKRNNIMLDVKVGDLFSNSWGYDQTNVDFYQVIAVKGKTFTIQRINGKCEETGFMSGKIHAVKDSFMDEKPMLKRGYNMEFGCLSKTTEEESHYNSWYA